MSSPVDDHPGHGIEPAATATPHMTVDRDEVKGLVARAGRDFGYIVGAFFVSLFGFIVTAPFFFLGTGVAVTVVGLMILAASLHVAGGFARFHRNLLAGAGYKLVEPIYPPHKKGFRGKIRRIAHTQSWRELLHVLVSFVVSVITFPLAMVWIAGGLGGITYTIWSRTLPAGNQGLAYLLGFPGAVPDIIVNTILGIFFLITSPFVIHGLVRLHAGIARGLLVDENTLLRRQISELAFSRAAAEDAELHTLRKLERDLHDGPQQRLVRLGMDITAAQRRIETEPAEAKAMLDAALKQSQDALAEIRTLSRGIAPPILQEQGLRAAITAIAARGTVPTTVDIPEITLPAAAQNAAYFVIAESLANMEKHSRALVCEIEMARVGSIAVISVTDDGVGGASLAKGHGLAGLADRVAGVDGSLSVSSPTGGPTSITATIPIKA